MLRLLTIDQALGRLDYDSLSDQALLEMLVERMQPGHKMHVKDIRSNYMDVCEWEYVNCKDDRVVCFGVVNANFDGVQFPFDFIPPLATILRLSWCNAFGTIDTSLLLLKLTTLDVSFNKLYGSLNFKSLPRTLQRIGINDNALTGSVFLSDLPDSLFEFLATCNNFSGSLSLENVPAAMEELDLSDNSLKGSVTIDSVMPSMREILLYGNYFTGDVRVLVISPNFTFLSIICNKDLSGTIILANSDGAMPFKVHHDCLTTIVDPDGNRHPWEETVLADFSDSERFE